MIVSSQLGCFYLTVNVQRDTVRLRLNGIKTGRNILPGEADQRLVFADGQPGFVCAGIRRAVATVTASRGIA